MNTCGQDAQPSVHFILNKKKGMIHHEYHLRQRFWQQHTHALALRTRNKIEEGRFVPIGTLSQWIQIRGEDRDNPVVLFLHGGPGIVNSAFTPIFRAWEHDFTLVQWDQPGAGKTFRQNGRARKDPLTIEGMVQDGIEATEWVLRHLNQRRLILFAISWGTVLGTLMVKRRPDLFWAYVGTGQFVNWTTSEPPATSLPWSAYRCGEMPQR